MIWLAFYLLLARRWLPPTNFAPANPDLALARIIWCVSVSTAIAFELVYYVPVIGVHLGGHEPRRPEDTFLLNLLGASSYQAAWYGVMAVIWLLGIRLARLRDRPGWGWFWTFLIGTIFGQGVLARALSATGLPHPADSGFGAFGEGLKAMIGVSPFGSAPRWLAFVTYPTYGLLEFFSRALGHQVAGTASAAIVVHGTLSIVGFQFRQKFRALLPELADVQAALRYDPARRNLALADVYARHGLNPLTFFLVGLVPVVVFLGVYFAFKWGPAFQGGPPFLWLPNLAARDPFFVVPVVGGIVVAHVMGMGGPASKRLAIFVPVGAVLAFLPSGAAFFCLAWSLLDGFQIGYEKREQSGIHPIPAAVQVTLFAALFAIGSVFSSLVPGATEQVRIVARGDPGSLVGLPPTPKGIELGNSAAALSTVVESSVAVIDKALQSERWQEAVAECDSQLRARPNDANLLQKRARGLRGEAARLISSGGDPFVAFTNLSEASQVLADDLATRQDLASMYLRAADEEREGVPIRERPSEFSRCLRRVTKGEEIPIVDRSTPVEAAGGWVAVRAAEQSVGWVYQKCIHIVTRFDGTRQARITRNRPPEDISPLLTEAKRLDPRFGTQMRVFWVTHGVMTIGLVALVAILIVAVVVVRRVY